MESWVVFLKDDSYLADALDSNKLKGCAGDCLNVAISRFKHNQTCAVRSRTALS